MIHKQDTKDVALGTWRQRRVQALQEALGQHAEQVERNPRHRIITYLLVLPLLGLTLLLNVGLQQIVEAFVFENTVIILVLTLIALWWGTGPALFYMLLSALFLDLVFLNSREPFSLLRWPNMLQLLPLIAAGIAIGMLSRMRERGWVRTRTLARELDTIRKQREHEAQLKDRFLSITVHEVQTPVTGIRIQSQLLQRRLQKRRVVVSEGEAQLQEGLQTINEQADLVARMIENLLDVARIQQQRLILHRHPIEITLLCRQVCEAQQATTGRQILFEPAPEAAMISADQQRLIQVLHNLLSNAIKYSPEQSPITVSVHRDCFTVRVEVRDQGIGIESEQQAHLFDLFYRSPQALASTTGGLGIGLAISKQIVELHDGHLWCVSEPGKGSSFAFVLPIGDTPP